MENEFIDRAQLEQKEAAEAKKKKEKRIRKGKERKTNGLVQILNGDFFTKEFVLNNLGFIFFVMFLLLLAVGKGYYGKQLSRDVAKEQDILDELTSDYFEAKARLEEQTKRSKLVEDLGPKGLKETENPTKVIRIKKEDK